MTGLFEDILTGIYSFVGNYGWAVILFSFMIKAVLLPLDFKSRKSMRAMSALGPKMEALKKRYANDQEKLNKKMSELYRANKVNPLSGCLPMLIQLPILIIMFSAMRNIAAELQLEQMYNWIRAQLMDAEGNFRLLENVQPFIDSLKSGEGAASFGNTDGWLWIKSVFQPDSFSKTFIPSSEDLSLMLNQYKNALSAEKMEVLRQYAQNAEAANGLAAAVDAAISEHCRYYTVPLIFNIVTVKFPLNWSVYVNGCFALPILAGLTQFLQTKLTPTAEPANNQNGSGKFMKWFFPIFSVWICISSTAAFAIYWVFVNIWGIVTNFAINKYIDMKNPAVSETEKEAIQP